MGCLTAFARSVSKAALEKLERLDRVHVSFLEHIDTILNSTAEL